MAKRDERHELGFDANFEVQVLANTLRDLINRHDPGAEIATAARGILMRIHDLSDIVFEAVFQDEDQRATMDVLRRQLGDR